ncbi:1,4-dihydroxy-6-naphthoate synthase [Niastella sp. OAS944]|uniref:1,4-dihydroxy-6-naphthoate synthase n=1 Tax=Niastella sp. OAS944 TaxID=2664089 RepID=UPI00348C0776|nr:1,4-dihydroxy-6-naphthoate synthase [Chitinophagaceae bacterium OAS944]
MTFKIGFSPCPNDTFIFDALVNNKIDTEGLSFQPVLEDVQTLNEWALQGKLDVTKISYGVLPLLLNKYIVLNAGGALGKGVGPLLITKQTGAENKDVNEMTIAVPGEHTTAHMLFSLAYPKAIKKKFMVFSAIEDAVLNDDVDAGVIIHENRFTYQQKGLHKLVDLGEYWERQTGNPIPLGGIVMKRSFDSALQQKVDGLIKRSLEYAFENYPLITDYVKQHSQEMSEAVMRQHIDLYVNNYSLQLGADGKAAVNTFLDIYSQLKQVNPTTENIFL